MEGPLVYSTVGCRRTGGRRSQPGSFLFFTTPANLVLIFESVFESRSLACCAQTVCDDACWAGNAAETFQTVQVESFRSQQCHRRSLLHSKRCLRVVKLFLRWLPGVFSCLIFHVLWFHHTQLDRGETFQNVSLYVVDCVHRNCLLSLRFVHC